MPLALTEAASLVGAMAFAAGKNPLALIGVLAHLLLGVGIWPSRARLDAYLGPDRRV